MPRKKSAESEGMTAAFKKICDRARNLLARAERNDVFARYKLGVLILKVQDQAKYGEGAIEKLEQELKLAPSTLYRYANVARKWPKDALVGLMGRVDEAKALVTWSHLELLADVADGRTRNGLLDQIIKGSLSVRGLQSLLPEKLQGKRQADGQLLSFPPKEAENSVTVPSTAIYALQKSMDGFRKIADIMARETGNLSSRIAGTLSAPGIAISESVFADAERWQKEIEELRDVLHGLAERLAQELKAGRSSALTQASSATDAADAGELDREDSDPGDQEQGQTVGFKTGMNDGASPVKLSASGESSNG